MLLIHSFHSYNFLQIPNSIIIFVTQKNDTLQLRAVAHNWFSAESLNLSPCSSLDEVKMRALQVASCKPLRRIFNSLTSSHILLVAALSLHSDGWRHFPFHFKMRWKCHLISPVNYTNWIDQQREGLIGLHWGSLSKTQEALFRSTLLKYSKNASVLCRL